MAYNKDHLASLSALLKLAQLVEERFAKSTDLSGLSEKVDALETAGGEKNVIEKISVNGAQQDVVDKGVNIKVPTQTSELTNNSDFQTSTDVENAIEALKSVLNGSGEGSIKEGASAAINEWAKQVTENETIDTFKEIVDYIAKHGGEAATMSAAISTLEESVEALDGAEKNYIASVTDEFAVSEERQLSLKSIAMSKVTDLESALGEKAESTHTHKAATGTEDGFMASTDKTKLDGIFSGATKVAKGENGHISINDVDTVVYQEPADVVHGTIATDEEVEEMLNSVFAA